LVETSTPSSTMGRPGVCVAVITRLPYLALGGRPPGVLPAHLVICNGAA
jgi:hypothetical protein